MKLHKTIFQSILKINVTLICIFFMTHISLAIEPIATIGQPLPEQHAFLNNNSILRVVATHIQVVDSNTGNVIDEFGEITSFSHVIFSPNAKHLAILNHSTDPRMTTVKIWDTIAREQISQWEIESVIYDYAAFNPTQPVFATYLHNEIHLWNWQTGESVGIIERIDYPSFKAMRFSADGSHIIFVSANNIEMWNTKTHIFEGHFAGQHFEKIEDIAISPNGKVIAVYEKDSPYFYVWDVATQQLLWQKRSGIGRIVNTIFSSDSQSIYVATETSGLIRKSGSMYGWDDKVRIWDVKSGQLIDTIGTEFRYIDRITLSPNGQNLLLHYKDAVVLWNTKEKQQQYVWADYPSWMVGLSSDGNTFISVSHTHYKSWDISSGKLNQLVSSEDELFEGFAFSPNGKKLAIGKDPWVEIRDIQTGKVDIQFPHFIGEIEAISFSPSGRLLAVGNDMGQISILDINNPDSIQLIDTRVNNMSICLFSKVAFSKNEDYIAASSIGANKYSVYVWKRDGNNFVNLYSWMEHNPKNESMLEFASTEEGTPVLATTGKDGIHIWNLLPEQPELLTKIDGWYLGRFNTDNRFLLLKRTDALQILDWYTDTLHEQVDIPRYYDVSQDGSVILSYTDAGQIQVWDGTKLLPSLPVPTTEPSNGKQLVTFGHLKRDQLLQNYPNPFNPETWIPFRLADESTVTIDIYSSTGDLVRSISPGTMTAGDYSNQTQAVHWDGMNNNGEPVSSGVYFYTINAGDFSATRKMLIKK